MKETMLDRHMNELRKESYVYNQKLGQCMMQLCFDASLIVLHDTFGFGRERCLRFQDELMKQIEEISEAVLSDTDPDAVYIKEKVDRKLAAIMGDEVVPWEERYAVSLGPARNREQRRAEKKRKKGRR